MTFSQLKGSVIALFVSLMLITIAYFVLPPVGYWVSSKDLFTSTAVIFSLIFTLLITILASKEIEVHSIWIYLLWIATFVLAITTLGALIDWIYLDPLRELAVGGLSLALIALTIFLIGWGLPAAAKEMHGERKRVVRRKRVKG